MALIEAPMRIEPARIEEVPERLSDLVADLSADAARLGASLHPRTTQDLAAMVRIMNSYYSNLIEGHNTRPRDIERALAGDFADDPALRDLQQENAAHVRLQERIDTLAGQGALPDPTELEFIKMLHREFYDGASEEMLTIEGAGGRSFRMAPGQWRSTPEHDVSVGVHVPPSSHRVPDFMTHFHDRFREDRMGKSARILTMATAHHRVNYIHPFPDGNGRVSRLMTHAMAHNAGIGAGGLWVVSRGLARGLNSRTEYHEMMRRADTPRQGDRDGRGNLSLAALVSFTEWFLKTAIDQVRYMGELFDLTRLGDRLERYVSLSEMKLEASRLLRAVLVRGEVERGEAGAMTGLAGRTAQRVVSDLVADGILASDTPKGPVSLRFPSHTHDVLFPKLFPEV